MLEHLLDQLPCNPLWWELIFVTLLVVIVLAPSGRRRGSARRGRGHRERER